MRRRQLFLALATLLSGQAVSATPDRQDSTLSDHQALLARLLDIVDQAGIIIPGEGFKSIKIGDNPEQLIRLWGKPKKISKKGVIDRKSVLSYQLQQKTIIHFIVDSEIELIIVQGEAGSLAHVNNGVVFSMLPAQVLSQFVVKPDKQTAKLIRYDTLGIELGFISGKLAEILIFPPR